MKTMALLLIAILTLNGSGFALQTGDAKQAAKAKAEVQKRGVGERSRVRVSLRDGTEVKGYISKVEENSFDVTDKKSGKAVAVSYNDVNKVKGPGLSKPAQVFIVVGVFVGVAAAVFLALLPKT